MADISIRGGKPLNGCVCIHGSKNAALPMMAASFLHKGISVLKGCPAIADVFCMEEILRQLGAVTWWEAQDLYMDCTHAEKTEIGKEYTGRMRSSVILLGVLLARCREGKLGYPGGCVIGKRPVDYHLTVLRSLGAELTEQEDGIMAKAGTLVGSEIQIPRRSVGATEQGILASVLAKGESVFRNCAREPEILWLCRYLRGDGRKDRGGRHRLHPRLRCEGAGARLHGGSAGPDRGGNVYVRGGDHPWKNCPGKSSLQGDGGFPSSISENRWTILQKKW